MAISAITFTLGVKINQRRVNQILQEAKAKISRARKRDRPAMIQRYADRIATEAVRYSV